MDTLSASIRIATPQDAPALADLRFRFRVELGEPAEPEAEFRERCARWMAERTEPVVLRALWLHRAQGPVCAPPGVKRLTPDRSGWPSRPVTPTKDRRGPGRIPRSGECCESRGSPCAR